MADALILFAHGSKDPEWVRPFEALRATVPRQVPASVVALAYLESATPDLSTCVRSLGDRGIIAVRVLPLFLAMGKHLRNDIPALAATVAREFAGLHIEFLPALGGTGVRRRAGTDRAARRAVNTTDPVAASNECGAGPAC